MKVQVDFRKRFPKADLGKLTSFPGSTEDHETLTLSATQQFCLLVFLTDEKFLGFLLRYELSTGRVPGGPRQ